MSIYDLLSKDQAAIAATQGWQLCHVVDEKSGAPLVAILPLAFGGAIQTAEAAYSWVNRRAASTGCLTSILALKLIAASRFTAPAKKAQKK
jgi:hypothetical protein